MRASEWIRAAVDDGFARRRKPKQQDGGQLTDNVLCRRYTPATGCFAALRNRPRRIGSAGLAQEEEGYRRIVTFSAFDPNPGPTSRGCSFLVRELLQYIRVLPPGIRQQATQHLVCGHFKIRK